MLSWVDQHELDNSIVLYNDPVDFLLTLSWHRGGSGCSLSLSLEERVLLMTFVAATAEHDRAFDEGLVGPAQPFGERLV